MADGGVNFTGKGGSDVSIDRNSTSQPRGGNGSGGPVDFVGKGAQDVTHMSNTKHPGGSVPEGGPLVSPVKD